MAIVQEKFSKVAKALAELKPGEHSIYGIVRRIRNIKNLKIDLDKLKENSSVYRDMGRGDTCNIRELYVDITYQRKVRLQKLVNQLEALEGYDTSVAGTIDTIVRPDLRSGKKFVWDGLRRTIMYGLCDGDQIRISQSKHPDNFTTEECIKEEARLFKIRNADSEKMTPAEIFKSKVIYEDEVALDQFSILKKADLNIEGLNPTGVTLGGFTLFDKCYLLAKYGSNGDLKEFRKSIIKSSRILQKVWPKDEIISLYVLCGFAYMLRVNDEYKDPYEEEDILEAFKDWKYLASKKFRKQSDITDVRLHGKAIPCIAYYIAKHILEDTNGVVDTIRQRLKDSGVKDEGFELLDEEEYYHSGL